MNGLNTERVIEEVRRRPELWDANDTRYRNKEVRQRAWTDVLEALFPDFLHNPEEIQKEIERVVQQRWKTCRDQYVRCVSALKNGRKKKNYSYFETMKFLDKKDVEETQDYVIQYNVESEGEPEMITPDERLDYAGGASLKRKRTTEELEHHDTDSPSGANTTVEILKLLAENNERLKNDDMAFFASLVPVIGKFDDYQKLTFRCAVLKQAMEIGHLTPKSRTVGNNSSTQEVKREVDSDDESIGYLLVKSENVETA